MKGWAAVALAVVLTGARAQDQDSVPFRLPELRDRALDGSQVVLPDSAAGYVALVGFGFSRDSEEGLRSWLRPFAAEFPDTGRYRQYQVAMMGGGVPGLLRGVIARGMRRGTPATEHPFFVPYYGDIKAYARTIGVPPGERVFVCLLDSTGSVRWKANGPATDERLELLLREAQALTAAE